MGGASACAACLLVLGAAEARAHLGHVVESAERYLKLDVSPGQARLVVSLMLAPHEMGRVLTAADADGDGVVTEPEAEAYVQRWSEGLAAELVVRLRGHAASITWGEPYMEPVGPVRRVLGSVELVGRIELPSGEATLVVEDAMRGQVFDRTDVVMGSRGGVQLVATGTGDAPSGRQDRFSYGPDLSRPVTFAAVVDTPPELVPARPSAFPLVGWVLAGMSVIALLSIPVSRLLRRLLAKKREA